MKTEENSLKHFKLVSHMVLQAVLIAALVIVPITSCSVDQVLSLVQDAAIIASAAGPIISAVSPEYGGLVVLAGKGLSDLSSLYSKYESASATEKPGVAGEIHAVTSTILGNLNVLFTDARIKNPQLQTDITAFVTAANTAIVALENKLGAPASQPSNSIAHAAVMSQAKALPVLAKAKSGDDLKKYWNGQVGATHPEAIVK
jgi:hypothetical protein